MLAVVAASIGMLPLIVLGALVLFERGTETANYVAGGLLDWRRLVFGHT